MHEQKLCQWDQERHQQIEASILHNGLVIDFDYATKLDQSLLWALTAGDHTGTIPFMLANIVIGYKKDKTMHSASDDFKLLIYAQEPFIRKAHYSDHLEALGFHDQPN
ncbi:hypothetical protein EDC04DRAFT_2613771 [Pisolithus marmoratus]|nr:hypothetical protein EDC04DRAFT_2613771 [Pisolithus marmoratus]